MSTENTHVPMERKPKLENMHPTFLDFTSGMRNKTEKKRKKIERKIKE